MKTNSITRRQFLKQPSVLAAGLGTLGGAASSPAATSPNEKVVVAVIGCNGRGMAHIAGYLALPNAEIGRCRARAGGAGRRRAATAVSRLQGGTVNGGGRFRPKGDRHWGVLV